MKKYDNTTTKRKNTGSQDNSAGTGRRSEGEDASLMVG